MNYVTKYSTFSKNSRDQCFSSVLVKVYDNEWSIMMQEHSLDIAYCLKLRLFLQHAKDCLSPTSVRPVK